jgi:hypothetical protein
LTREGVLAFARSGQKLISGSFASRISASRTAVCERLEITYDVVAECPDGARYDRLRELSFDGIVLEPPDSNPLLLRAELVRHLPFDPKRV